MLKPIYRFFIAVLCGYLALGATLQVLPIYMTTHFHASTFLIATIIAIASIAAAIARPFAGYIADNGLAKRTVLFGSILGILGGVGHWLAGNLLILFGARLLLGAGEGVLFTAAVTWAITQYPPAKRGAIAGWFGLSMWGGLCFGPILAAWVMNLTHNVTDVWVIVSILPLFGFILVCGMALPDSKDFPTNINSQCFNSEQFLPRGAIIPGVAFLLTSYGYGTINALLIIYLLQQRIGGEELVLPLFAIAFLITRICCSQIVSRLGGKIVLLSVMTIEIFGLSLLTSVQLPFIVCGTILTGIGVALLYPAFVSVLLNSVAINQQGKSIGFMTSFWDLGLVIAGPIGGLIANYLGFQAVFIVAAGLSFLAFLIILILIQGRVAHASS